MSDKMNEPREFWLLFPDDGDPRAEMIGRREYKSDTLSVSKHVQIHVIEYSVHLAEKARADKAERMLAKAVEQRNFVIRKLATHNFDFAAVEPLAIKTYDAELESIK